MGICRVSEKHLGLEGEKAFAGKQRGASDQKKGGREPITPILKKKTAPFTVDTKRIIH